LGRQILTAARVEANDLKFGTQLGFGYSLLNNVLGELGKHRKKLGIFIYATVEADNSKFGTQHGFGKKLVNNNY